jgi:DNA-directed RNA polymerase specialized sigma24 family protein
MRTQNRQRIRSRREKQVPESSYLVTNPENMTQIFNQYRALLFSLTSRLLGSATDAEDSVQEAFLRWLQASDEEIQSRHPPSFRRW